MKALVMYYSMGKRTEKAAGELAGYLEKKGHKATQESIIPKSGYSIITAYTLGCMQARRRSIVGLNPMKNNPSDFDIVAVLSPTWAFTCAPPAYSFVSGLPNARKGQKAIVITTNQGSPGDGPKALADVLEKKGYVIAASVTVSDSGKLSEILDKELKL